jgi:uncharacterized membrane protein
MPETLNEPLMKIHELFLFLTTFLASAIEIIEMVIIVLGVGMTRGWPATLGGAVSGVVVLCGVIAALGPALTFVPISVLRATVGILLLLFGVQWLRKGIFRLSKYGFRPRAKVDDEEELADLRKQEGRIDWTGFVLAFKGVLLEGLEVAFIIVTFGAATHHWTLAVISSAAAFVIVVAVTTVIQKALKGIPNHVIKFAVGLLLVTFGTYWAAEGLGVDWPGEDLSIVVLLAAYFLFALACLSSIRRSGGFLEKGRPKAGGPPGASMNHLKQFALFWYRFIIGDDRVGAAIIFGGFIATYPLVKGKLNGYWLLPLAVMASLSVSLFRLSRNGTRWLP